MQIKDKRAIVTGAASKLGLAFSRELLRNGATKVLMIDNREEEGKGAMERLNFEFGRNRAIFLPCDVTRSTDFNITFKDAINILGGLDILINNASVINEADFVKAIDVNVTALIRSTLLGIQQMRRDSGGKGGVVLNVSSIAGLYALPQLPVYSTAKHAVVNFSRSFAQPYHYQRTKVRIIVLCPGVTEANHEDFRSNLMDPQVLQKYQPQRVESVAHGLVYAIRCAQNGTIWISEQEAFEEASILMTEIDIVINNAGILDERRWEREIAVNITGMISTAMLAVKHMSKESGGHGGILVNVSEHMNIGNTAQLPVYAATKHAIIGLSQSLADPDHYERTGIRIITLCPGLTETGLTIDSPNKLLSRVMKADFVKNLEHVPIQTPYIVAQGLLNVLRFGESGSIWVIESGRQPYEIYVPNPRTLRRRYKNNMSYVETKIGKGRKITKVYDNSTRTSVICV